MRRNTIEIAREYYRSPVDHEDLVDPSAPVPAITSDMMNALSKEDHSGSGDVVLTADIRKAACFTLEKIIFAPGGDYYRVLGLDRNATADRVRSNYDQLQKIFFDQDKVDEWNNDYAMRINRAYRTLRDPEKRRAYDEILKLPDKAKQQGTTEPAHEPGHSSPVVDSYIANSVHRAFSGHEHQSSSVDDRETEIENDKSLDQHLDTLPTGIYKSEDDVRWHRPLISLFRDKTSLALLSGIVIILSIYIILLPPVLRNFPTESPETAIAADEPAPSSLHGQVVRDPPANDTQDPARIPDPPDSTDTPDSVADLEIDDLPATRDPAEIVSVARISAMETTDDREPEELSAPAPPRQEMTTPTDAVTPTLPPSPALPPPPVIELSPGRLVVSASELDTLKETFASAYKSGDLDLLLSLFTEDARTNERVDKSGIRSDYQDLFDATESREFLIRDMRWQQGRDGGVSGAGTFEVNIRFSDDGSTSSLTGDIMLHVEKSPQGTLITELRHAYH